MITLIMGECPMTKDNTEAFHVSSDEVKDFCEQGCCPACAGWFIIRFGNRLRDDEYPLWVRP